MTLTLHEIKMYLLNQKIDIAGYPITDPSQEIVQQIPACHFFICTNLQQYCTIKQSIDNV